ncbi:MAG: YraN family protein [Eubacteriales bacterium]|nr:YraN family protein [Eubacteriales bacterium]
MKENEQKKWCTRREVGSRYEYIAASYLERNGVRIIERNYQKKTGEIDLIAQDGEYLVFIEVKYRSDGQTGEPLSAVDYRKQKKICRTAQWYMEEKKIGMETPCRFDVIGILGKKITWVRDAFLSF